MFRSKQIVTLVVVSLLLTSGFASEAAKIQPWSTVFAQVQEQGKFGKSMASLVQMHIETSDPQARLQEINDLIKDIYAIQVETNDSEAERIAGVRAECESTIGSLENSLTEKTGQLQAYEDERDALREEQGKLRVLLAEEEQNLAGMQDDLAQAESDLQTENEQYEIKQRDYNSLIVACESGIDLLTHMLHGEDQVKYSRNGKSFIQLVQVKDSFAEVLHHFKQHSSVALLEPVLTALVSISSQTSINYEQFLQCIELLQDILSRLRGDLALLTSRHNQIVEDLTTLINNLKEWIAISIKIIDIYQERLNEITNRLAELDALIAEITELIGVVRKQLADKTADCQSEEDFYNEAQPKRESEMALMEKLIEYFESQVVTAVNNVREEE